MFNIIDTLHAKNAQEQGFLYGQLCSAQIGHSRATYSRLFAQCGISWEQACDKAMAMQDAISALDPSFLDEMRGIAEGAGVRFDDILALNCRTEILPAEFLGVPATQAEDKFSVSIDRQFPSPAQKQAAAVFGEGECTALALMPSVSADGKTWLAQNWDWIGTQRHTQKRPLQRQDLEALLRDESDGYLSVCRHPNPDLAPDARVESVAGVIINVTDRTMWIAPNVPSKAEFEQVI